MMLTATLDDNEYEPGELEALMIQALVWSLGAPLIESSRIRFDAFLKYLASLILIYDEKKAAGLGSNLMLSLLCFSNVLTDKFVGVCTTVYHSLYAIILKILSLYYMHINNFITF